VVVKIAYDNTRPWGASGDPGYVYELSAIPHTSYKSESIHWADRPAPPPAHDSLTSSTGNRGKVRQVVDLHGILFVVEFGGRFGAFNTTTLLLLLTTSLSLLAVAGLVTEYIMLYLLKQRRLYSRAKYEEHAKSDFQSGRLPGPMGRSANASLLNAEEDGISIGEAGALQAPYSSLED
jgi:hypothetical protein